MLAFIESIDPVMSQAFVGAVLVFFAEEFFFYYAGRGLSWKGPLLGSVLFPVAFYLFG
jgi:hypothetical protein